MIITGSTGILGKELLKLFLKSIHPTHDDLELSDRNAVFNFIKNNNVDKIIHTAALTGIRDCEEDRPKAWKYNVQATENLVEDEARNRVEDKGEYYVIHPYWSNSVSPETKEYSSDLHTIDNPIELERLLLSADNLTWNYPKISNANHMK